MAFGSISPVGIQAFYDANGNPLAGGKLQFYLAGTTTPSPAYADVNLTTPLANPVILDAAGRAPELFLGALAYKQVLQNALGTTIWTADNIVTPTALRSTQALLSITGSQSNVPVPSGIVSFMIFTNATAVTIDGFANGTPGQILVLRAGNVAPVYLLHAQGSTAGNQLFNFVSSGPTALAGVHGVAIYLHDGNYWVLISHTQGQALRVPYLATNYVSSAGGTWTVDAGDIVTQDYLLNGTTVTMTTEIQTSSVAGSPPYVIAYGWPYLSRTNFRAPGLTQYGAAPYESVMISTGPGQRFMGFTRSSGPFPDGTGNVAVFGQLTVDVI